MLLGMDLPLVVELLGHAHLIYLLLPYPRLLLEVHKARIAYPTKFGVWGSKHFSGAYPLQKGVIGADVERRKHLRYTTGSNCAVYPVVLVFHILRVRIFEATAGRLE